MAAKRKRKQRRSKVRARNSEPPSFWLFFLTRLLAGGIFAVSLVFIYLDYEIRQRFEGNVQSEPAHVYARPVEIYPGAKLDRDKIEKNLQKHGYSKVEQISEPGQYASAGNLLDIYIRQVDAARSVQPATAVRVAITEGRVQSVTSHSSAAELSRVMLDPPLIGSLQLGAYKDRIALELHEMPQLLVQALLVMEDRNFESHFGVDPKAILRALWSNIQQGRAVQGGSTLTQQLVKNLFLSPERTIGRKATEALMAITMEMRFSKQEILEFYVNEIFLGQSGNRAVHGFALASEYFFGQPVSELKLHETALLVGMIPAPSFYNPRRHPDRALARRNLVISELARAGAISSATAEVVSQRELGIVPHSSESSSDFPAYIDYMHRQLRQYYSEEVLRTSGLRLYTSLDAEIQRIAQSGLSETLTTLEQSRGFEPKSLQGAVIVVDQSRGEILALVGDRVKGYSGFNRAIDAERPIGSLVKPAVYLTALENPRRYSLATMLEDSPLTLTPKGGDTWSPENYDRKFRGPVPLYSSLANSYNLPTVRLGLDVGVESVVSTLRRLGINRDMETYPSTLLGASHHTPLEVAQIYQVFANQGLLVPLRSIRAISNQRGETIARFSNEDKRSVSQHSALLIDYALKLVVRQGTAAGLARTFSSDLGLAGKTGTTDDHRDSWFAGYSGNYLTVVWVGRDDNRPAGLSGSSGAMRVWENVMSDLDIEPGLSTENPDIVYANVDPVSGLLANRKCPSFQPLPFIEGSEPEAFAPCSGIAAQMKSWFSIKSGDTSLPATQPEVEDKNR